jgi:hypothetical protein
MKAAVLVGSLEIVGLGAHAPNEAEVACTRAANPRRGRPGRLQAPPHHRPRFRRSTSGQAAPPAHSPLRGNRERRASPEGIPTKPRYDRDEYPPAMSDEGGNGADVRYVRSAENRSAGSVMRFQLARYCNEQRFIFERWRNR